MSDKYLKETYSLDSPQKTQAHYENWAPSYEDEVSAHGYATPARVAEALWAARPQADLPILDYGCGTGLSGMALQQAGFDVIDGIDPTPRMLEGAAAKEIYRKLSTFEITDPDPLEYGAYQVIAAIGVIGAGAAPPETLDLLIKTLSPGGLLGFSFNDHTLADRLYTDRLAEWLDGGKARLLFREHGPHLPGLDLGSDVYVITRS